MTIATKGSGQGEQPDVPQAPDQQQPDQKALEKRERLLACNRAYYLQHRREIGKRNRLYYQANRKRLDEQKKIRNRLNELE